MNNQDICFLYVKKRALVDQCEIAKFLVDAIESPPIEEQSQELDNKERILLSAKAAINYLAEALTENFSGGDRNSVDERITLAIDSITNLIVRTGK